MAQQKVKSNRWLRFHQIVPRKSFTIAILMDSLVSAPGLIQMVMQILTGMEIEIQGGFIFLIITSKFQ